MSTTSELTPDPAVVAAVRDLGTAPDTYGPTLNTAVSTSAVECIGQALAERLRPYAPTAVTFWNTGDEAVLGHVVARELGAAVVRADDVQGIVTLSCPAAPGTRVALLATEWTSPVRLKALTAVTRTKSGDAVDIVAVASVLGTPEQAASGVPVVCLLSREADRP